MAIKKKDFYLFLLIIKTSRTVFSFKEGNFGYFPFDDAKRGLKVRALTQPAKADAPNFSRLFFPSIWKGRWYPTTATFWSFSLQHNRGHKREEEKKFLLLFNFSWRKKKGDPSSFQKDVREKL